LHAEIGDLEDFADTLVIDVEVARIVQGKQGRIAETAGNRYQGKIAIGIG
jgi:hypothetical protein